MTAEKRPGGDVPEAESASDGATQQDSGVKARKPRLREIGGRNGPDPTRYGDWEKNGRCIDF